MAAFPNSTTTPEIRNESEPLTDELLSAMDWEPWTHKPDEWTPPSNAEWNGLANPHLVTLRFSWIILHKSKLELIEALKDLDTSGALTEMVESIGYSIEFFETFVRILRRAEIQVFCASASLGAEDAA